MKLSDHFSRFMCNNLKEMHGITTVEEAQALTDAQLLKARHVGKMFIEKLRRIKVETQTIKNTIIPVRAKCAQCGQLIKIEYHVSDEIWFEAVPKHLNNSRICLNCLMTWADEKFLPWDESILLCPTSFFTQRKIQVDVKNGNYNDRVKEWHVPPTNIKK